MFQDFSSHTYTKHYLHFNSSFGARRRRMAWLHFAGLSINHSKAKDTVASE